MTVAAPTPVEKRAASTAKTSSPVRLALRHCMWCVIALIGGLLFIETILWTAHAGEEQFVELEPTVGTWHMANKAITWRSEGFSHSFTNSLGFREREFAIAKPSGVKRIVILGDSMAEGMQVDLSQTFGSILERKLNEAAGHQAFQVINAAMSGHSTVQELYLFKTRIAALKPDICILGYGFGASDKNCSPASVTADLPRPCCAMGPNGNLLTDWSHYDESLNSSSARFFKSTEFLRRHSRLWDVLTKVDLELTVFPPYSTIRSFFFPPAKPASVKRFTSTSMDILGTTRDPKPILVDATTGRAKGSQVSDCAAGAMHGIASAWLHHSESGISRFAIAQPGNKEAAQQQQATVIWRQGLLAAQQRFYLTARIIQELNAACRSNDCRLVVLAMPAPDNSMLYFRELRWLRKLADADGFSFVDANERFPRRAPMQASPFFYNVHMSARGHALIADQLYDTFKQTGLLTCKLNSNIAGRN